jgi:hypothetical protein
MSNETTEIRPDSVFGPSEDVVTREIEGELILVPLAVEVGGPDEELYTLNESGRAIWSRLNGKATLREVVQSLSEEYDVSRENLTRDVEGLVRELLSRHMLVDLSAGGAFPGR